jgi:hypothetical protein
VWNPGLFFGDSKIPQKSSVLLAVVTALSIIWFVAGWKFGMEYQGARYTYAVCSINLVSIGFLALGFLGKYKESSFTINLLLHWIMFACLAWFAFPYLGELP